MECGEREPPSVSSLKRHTSGDGVSRAQWRLARAVAGRRGRCICLGLDVSLTGVIATA